MRLFDALGGSGSKGDADGTDTDTNTDTDTDAEQESLVQELSPRELIFSDDYSVTGDEYHDDITSDEVIGDEKMVSTIRTTNDEGEEVEDVIAGPHAREMIEAHYLNDDQPLFLGYDVQRQEVQRIGIKISHACRHLWIPGTSGAGKSTLFSILQVQMAYHGLGFVHFDPKGQDSRELLAKLPEHRLDDVVFVDPANPKHDRTVSLNFVEVPQYAIEDEGSIEDEISARVQNLKAFFEGDQFWGANMEFITGVLGHGMLKSNAEHLRNGGDPSEQYTIIDFFSLVLNSQIRENFAEDIDDQFLQAAVERVASMDDDETLPTLKRVVPWVINGITRKVISHRESSIDFNDVIENDKIVIVRTAVENTDIKQMLTLGVMRNLWSAIQRRASLTDGEPKPYFVFADEFDDIASNQLDMDRMLTKARSMRLGVIIANQYPDQIGEDYPEVLRAITNNCNTLAAFRMYDEDNARVAMERFNGFGAEDLLDTDDFEAWTEIPVGEGTSDPMKIQTIAPPPNLRSMDEVDDIIDERLQETGVEPLTTEDIIRDLPYDDPYGVLESTIENELHAEEAQRLTEEGLQREVTRAVFHEAIFRGKTLGHEDDEWWVPVDEALHERAKRYCYGGIDTEQQLAHHIDTMAGDHLRKRQNDGREVTVTSGARSELFITGRSQTSGKSGHRDLAEDTILALLRLGLESDVVHQSGGRDVDGVVRIREIVDTSFPSGMTPSAKMRALRERYEEMADEHPLLTWLTDGADATVEMEKSTGTSKGGKTIRNLAKAHEVGEACIFTARPADAQSVWNAVADPPLVSDVDEDGVTTFYNDSNYVRIGGLPLVMENASKAQWLHDPAGDEYLLCDEDGTVRAHFDTHHEIFSNKSKYDGVEEDYADEELGRNGPHLRVRKPVIPVRLFDVDSRDEVDVEKEVRVLGIPESIGSDERNIEDIVTSVSYEGEQTLSEVRDSIGGGDGLGSGVGGDDNDDDDDDDDDDDADDDGNTSSYDDLLAGGD